MPRPRDPTIDEAVVTACVQLLDEVGRAGLTRALVARRAGVSLPAVNRRFDDVDDVLLAVASTPGHDRASTRGADSLRSFLLLTVQRMAKAMRAGSVRRPAAELLAAAAGDERIEKALGASLAEVRADGHAWVERARHRGEVDPATDADLLLDLVQGAVYYRLLWRGEAVDEGGAAALVDAVLSGCTPGRP